MLNNKQLHSSQNPNRYSQKLRPTCCKVKCEAFELNSCFHGAATMLLVQLVLPTVLQTIDKVRKCGRSAFV